MKCAIVDMAINNSPRLWLGTKGNAEIHLHLPATKYNRVSWLVVVDDSHSEGSKQAE